MRVEDGMVFRDDQFDRVDLGARVALAGSSRGSRKS
jgi:hypothetical protein